METKIQILHLEDDKLDGELVQAKLMEADVSFNIIRVQTREDFKAVLLDGKTDIILADYYLPTYDGLSALKMARELFQEVPFIFVSGAMGEEIAIEALTTGATDYVLKENLSRLPSAISRALLEVNNQRERKQAELQVVQLSFAMNGIHEAAFMMDKNGHFHYVNDEACRILGYQRDELLSMTLPAVQSNSTMDQWSRHWNNLKTNGAFTFEEELQNKDGCCFPVEINANYFEYEGQSFDLSLVRDITERRKVEHERLTSLKFFSNMDKVNRAIQGADNLETMMKDLLDIVRSIFDCDRAFLQYPCDPDSPTWSIPMESTKAEYPGSSALTRAIPMDSQVAERLRILLAIDGPVTSECTSSGLPEDVAMRFGIKSIMSMAIYPKTGSPWQFGLHQCSHVRDWAPEEKRLLQAIGRRLADALTSLLSYRDLDKNEKFLDSVVDHIPIFLFVKDAETQKIIRTNKAAEQLLGYSQEELLDATEYDLFPREVADVLMAEGRQALERRELVDIPEETIPIKTGEEVILHTKKIPIMDETGTPLYLLGISEDITKRKQSEEFIRKLSMAVEQSPVSIIITDLEGKIEFVNARFCQITGYTFSEAVGKNPRILQSDETSADEYHRLWQTIISGGIWQGEICNRKKNGELFWEQATIAPVRDEDNLITHYVAVKEDITERKILVDQLQQSQRMEAIGQLAGGVAHDFNNMLGVIIGRAEMALTSEHLDEPMRKHIDQILQAGRRSAEITRQLLAFARKQTIAPKILDLNETVEGMLKLLRRLIGEEVELAWLPGSKLWPVKMDPSQIDQILANLCVNARDAINRAGKIILQTKNIVLDEQFCTEHKDLSAGKYLVLIVRDDGCGMNKTTIDKIFEPFYTTKGLGKGTGLGLSTVYGIVKQNAGTIDVHSKPGVGTTFQIFLPRSTDLDGQEPEVKMAEPILTGNETILVAEDEISNLMTVKLLLERYGYQVLAASSPSEALRLAQEYKSEIHMLLTDLIMPEMNGKELAKEMKHLFPDMLCLFMSGYTSNIIVHNGVLDAGLHFMEKPFSKKALATKVRAMLDKN